MYLCDGLMLPKECFEIFQEILQANVILRIIRKTYNIEETMQNPEKVFENT